MKIFKLAISLFLIGLAICFAHQPYGLQAAITSNAASSTILLNIPFTAQAPFARWSDSRQQDGCEEASAVMIMFWLNKKFLTKAQAEKEIIAISNFEQKNYKNYHDTSALDTVKRIFNGYYKSKNAEVKNVKNIDDIIKELQAGHSVIVPVNGQVLKNPYYTQPGPERHNLVIRGYDFKTKEFITNDSGTRRGEQYRYLANVLFNALRDYPTGYKKPIAEIKKTMIVIRP